MKRWPLVLVAAAMVLPLAGCKRESGKPPKPFDPAVDAPPSVVPRRIDQNILSGKGVAGAPADKAASPTAGLEPSDVAAAPAPPAGGGDPIEEVKQTLSRMVAAAAGSPESLADFFADEDAPLARTLFVKSAGIAGKLKELESAFAAKSTEMPGEAKLAYGLMAMAFGAISEGMKQMPVDQVELQSVGETVVVKGSQPELTFAKEAGVWKVSLTAEQKAVFEQMAKAAEGASSFFDELIAGVNDDSITADNFMQKSQEIQAKYKDVLGEPAPPAGAEPPAPPADPGAAAADAPAVADDQAP